MKEKIRSVFTNRWMSAAALAVALYALLGFFVLPRLIEDRLQTWFADRQSHEFAAERLAFNPFTLAATLEGLRLADASGSPLLELARFRVNFDWLSSLYRRAWVLGDVSMTEPRLRIVIGAGGRSNLAALFGDGKGASAERQDTVLPRFLLEEAAIRRGQFDFIDRRGGGRPADLHVKSISLELDELSTLPDRTGGYTLSGRTKKGERLQWRGGISLDPFRSSGSFELAAVKAATVWEFLKAKIRCRQPGGEARLSGGYVFDLSGDRTDLVFQPLSFDISGLSVALPGEDTPLLAVAEATGRNGRLDLRRRVYSLERFAVDGGSLRFRIESGGVTNWSRLTAGGSEPESPRADSGAEARQGGRASWSGALQTLDLKNVGAGFTDTTSDPAASILLAPLDLSLTGLSTDRDAAVDFDLASGVGAGGEITVAGRLKPWHPGASGRLEIAGLSLLPLQPYIGRLARVFLESGQLEASGDFAFDGAPAADAFTYRGSVGVSSLRVRIDDGEKPALGWATLSLPDVRLGFGPTFFELGDAELVGPYGRLVISEDGTVNLARAAGGGNEKRAAAGDAEKGTNAFRFAAGEIRVKDGELDFADLSLSPRFRTHISALKGSIAGVSSSAGDLAGLELRGRVGQHGAVRIEGGTNFFSPAGRTDVAMDFDNLAMTDLTPYAVRFAGYRIASGKLSLDLRYDIRDGKMVGRNRIVAERLTLGERVGSRTALDLPFELAVALLKDERGVIDIEVPVSGNLREPQFDLGAVLRKALGRFLRKVVTAPFSWLASLAGTDKQDLDEVYFEAGRAVLAPPEEEKLARLAGALQKRPQLRLQIRGGYRLRDDVPALKSDLARKKLAAEKNPARTPAGRPGPVVFHDQQTRKALEAVFLENNPPAILSALKSDFRRRQASAGETGPGNEATGQAQPADWSDFYRDLLARIVAQIELPAGRLEALARERALAVRQFLLKTEKVEAGRAEVLEPARADKASEHGVATRLSLDTAD